ncbi:unnamed protein product, partial [marine sediment metagenome]
MSLNHEHRAGMGVAASHDQCATRPPWQERWLNRFYCQKSGWVDGTTQFKDMCRKVIPEGARILELGPGPTNEFTRFLATLGEVTGLDVDDKVLANEACSKAVLYDGRNIPFASESFDVVASNYVVEHVEEPRRVVAEVRRVLRPGGVYVFRAPNVWHPVVACSALTPHLVHKYISTWARRLPAEDSVYP